MVNYKKPVLKAFIKRNCLGLKKTSIFIIFTVKRNVLAHFWHVQFVILGAGLARISFRDLVFDIEKRGFRAPRMDEIVYSGIIGFLFFV